MLMQVKRLEDQNLALGLQLETCTGRPAADWGSIPATPSDLNLPNQASHLNQNCCWNRMWCDQQKYCLRDEGDESDVDVKLVAIKGHC